MEKKIAYRASLVSIVGNVFLSLFKLLSGIIGHSHAMISDAIHSISDVLSTVVVMIGFKISSKDIDENHPYGHERFECIASLVLAFMLFSVGLLIGYEGILKIITGKYKHIAIPTLLPLIAAIISIVTKEIMYIYTKKCAKKINSNALLADAYHHRSDSLSSIGSLIGIGASLMGYPICDSIASIIICFFIFKVSIEIFKDTIDKLVDKSCDITLINDIKQDILENNDVLNIDLIKTRMFGNKIYVDIEIAVNKDLSLIDAHNIAEKVHDKLEEKYINLKHCMIHVNPYEGDTNA
ncbi:MAG: cation transporter [Bacilli bacterium]|nr:cation transporter [Bacilli bacterium]